jgi:hypothetical protein
MLFKCVSKSKLSALFCASLVATAAFAQSERGTITGTIVDTSGAVVPGARVTVTNTLTNVSSATVSTESGTYTAASLPVGEYRVRVEKAGFSSAVLSGISLNAASTMRVDATLEVGTALQTVEVSASAQLLSTESAKTSVTVTNKLVDELPLVVGGTLRSPFDLASLTPEAKNIGGDDGFILGGGQAAGYGATLDGVSANTTRALQLSWVSSNAPSLEAVTEFTVDTNGFKAEYGHASGGVMTFSSKSGTNQFHGSAYEFLRNTDLDANRFFSNRSGTPRAIYKQNDFGFSAGGPIWIPKIHNGKDKSFFFFAYEGFRNRAGATAFTTTVPTPEMYNGDFSKWVDSSGKMIPVYDPTSQVISSTGAVTRQQFANNQIPKSMFDPFSVKAISVFQTSGALTPNTGAAPGTVGYVNNNYSVANGSQVAPINKFSIKGDHIFSARDRISGYYGYDREYLKPGTDGPAGLPGLYVNYNDLRQFSDVFRMSWDHTFSPTKLNHFYAGGNNWRQDHNPPQEYIGNWKDKICLGNVPDCNENLVNFSFSNSYGGWGGNANNGSENTIYGFNDDFTWIRGAHSFKFGGMYQLSHYNGFGRQCISGCATFSFTETGRGGDTNFATAGGNPFASMLLGWADAGQIDTIRFIGQQWGYYAGYFQDDWRVSSKLTLNLGIRWEVTMPPSGLEDRWSDFSPTRPNPAANNIPGALIYAGSGQGREGSRTLADSYYHGFGPHLGFAYTLNSKTVVRGSYALAYGAITTVTGSTHQRGFTLTYSPSNGSNGIQPTFILSQGFPAWKAPPFIDPSFSNADSMPWWQGNEATRPPEMHNFNFSIQRQLSPSTVLEASYNAVLGTHLQANLLGYNQVNPIYLAKYGTALLNSAINSPAAIAAGISAPFPGFQALWGSRATVAQALRPFPQYNSIDTAAGGGDHSGHSTYHAGIIRLERRYSNGLQLQTSYVFSKILTDADSYWQANDFARGADHFNRGLEKSIGAFDVTHNFKVGLVYEAPLGKGKRYLNHGVAAVALGNWRISATQYYSSGLPISLSTTLSQPLFGGRNIPYINSYDGWRALTAHGSFDPSVDAFLVPYGTGPFPLQGAGTPYTGFGNATRYNPKVREFPNYNENFSVAKGFQLHEKLRLDFRAEAFNAFNRVRFGTGSTSLQSQSFGRLTSNGDLLNSPRQVQLAMKLYW